MWGKWQEYTILSTYRKKNKNYITHLLCGQAKDVDFDHKNSPDIEAIEQWRPLPN